MAKSNHKLISKPAQRLLVTGMALLTAILQSGCAGAPDGVEVVAEFELSRYLGTWYEIARLDHSFERCSSATHFALMSALSVVVMDPLIQIGL